MTERHNMVFIIKLSNLGIEIFRGFKEFRVFPRFIGYRKGTVLLKSEQLLKPCAIAEWLVQRDIVTSH